MIATILSAQLNLCQAIAHHQGSTLYLTTNNTGQACKDSKGQEHRYQWYTGDSVYGSYSPW